MTTETAADAPVNLAEATDTERQVAVAECVNCGDEHRHGLDRPLALGMRSYRDGECGGYHLKLRDYTALSLDEFRWAIRGER